MLQADLPILQHRQDILRGIERGRVLVVSGRTGCGKSTQLPQFILSAHPDAVIAVCQPRRLAATSLAMRVSQQVKSPLGAKVGYQIGMQSRLSSKTQVLFMTYGILIQQLLFNKEINYTHIILDEVHERSLQMDFTFIALKKILDQPDKQHIKIIVMSATINSLEFSRYFSTHIKDPRHPFLRPQFTFNYVDEENRRTRGRNADKNTNKILKVETKYINKQLYQPCECIDLPDKKMFNVEFHYADEILDNTFIPKYQLNEDVRIDDATYGLAVRIITERLFKQEGDILIFVPGMFEIKTLKTCILARIPNINADSVIEVHSAYSEDLHKKLFVDKIKNKIIIATNIGQSSITLPFCRTVIDFCLNRKNIMVKKKGYSKFETRVASQSNLLQRSGRVGRVADGEVFRLIEKSLFSQLEEFDVPEIKCVTLEMVILRAKQIDKTYKSILFEDPYEVFLNAIDPPEVGEIHHAVQSLLHEDALVSISQKNRRQKPDWKPTRQTPKFEGADLKLTEVGEYMVSMPCDLRISKMILLSLQLNICSTIVDIAGILMCQKGFFLHEEKRQNIQEYMHSVVGYDKENYNDFLLRQRMFSHWRSSFFMSFYHKASKKYKQKQQAKNMDEPKPETPKDSGRKQSKYELSLEDMNNGRTDRMLADFSQRRITREQWDWCSDRGVSPHVMREILKNSESLRDRLRMNRFQMPERGQQSAVNELVILCMSIAFEETTCAVEFKTQKFDKKAKNLSNSVALSGCKHVNSQQLFIDYFAPNRDYELTKEPDGSVLITGSPAIVSKLLLPAFYTKASRQKASELYKFLATTKSSNVMYTYEPADITDHYRNITILNESINKALVRPHHDQDYNLITDKIFQTKGRYYMGSCALVERKMLLLIKMMTRKVVMLEPHPSKEFYARLFVDKEEYDLPFILKPQYLETIQQVRSLSLWDKNDSIQRNEKIRGNMRERVLQLLKDVRTSRMLEPWNKIFDVDVEKIQNKVMEPVPIQRARPLQLRQENNYFERYKTWKKKLYASQLYNYRILSMKNCCLICAQCWPNKITHIEELEAFDVSKGLLKLNQYRGSWKDFNEELYCFQGHHIGKKLNDDEGSIKFESISMYCPFEQEMKFTGDAESIAYIKSLQRRGQMELQEERESVGEFQCKICAQFDSNEDFDRKIIEKKGNTDKFWKQVTKHMISQSHIREAARFIENI